MEFRHLPVAGGIYDQHPKLLDCWSVIWRIKAVHDKRERALNERKNNKGKASGSTGTRAGRRRGGR